MGAYDEADVIEQVWTTIRDTGGTVTEQLLTDTEILRLTRAAEPHYSTVRPREKVKDLTANGTSFLAIPATNDGWVDGFSSILSLEYPVNEAPPSILDPRTYIVNRDTNGAERIVWLETAPANSATVRCLFTTTRTYNATAASTTVLDIDHFAVCDLIASYCADAIAAKYARTSEPAFNADAVNYRTKAQEWQSVAKRLWARWESSMGIGSASSAAGKATSAWVNWDARSMGAISTLTHPRSGR